MNEKIVELIAPALPAIPMPDRIARLPRLGEYPVPFFVATVDGVPDFRVVRPDAIWQCHTMKLCWLCGQGVGTYKAFVVGPMCAINKVSSEPPSHKDCAIYAAQVCPFLANPERARREENLPEHKEMAGVALKRNPGVTLVWVTKSYKPFRAPGGVLFELGPAEGRHWIARGRKATVEEVKESIASGIHHLEELALSDGEESLAQLNEARAQIEAALPGDLS